MKPFRELAAKFRREAELLESRGAEPQATLARAYAEELEDAIRAFWHEELTVREAARENGCSESKMRKMIDDREVPRAGSNPTTVLRADLPCYRGMAPGTKDAASDELARDALLASAGGR